MVKGHFQKNLFGKIFSGVTKDAQAESLHPIFFLMLGPERNSSLRIAKSVSREN